MRKAIMVLLIAMFLLVGAYAAAGKPTEQAIDPNVAPVGYYHPGSTAPQPLTNDISLVAGEGRATTAETAPLVGSGYFLSSGHAAAFENAYDHGATLYGAWAYAKPGQWLWCYIPATVTWNAAGKWYTAEWFVYIPYATGADLYYTDFYDGNVYEGYDTTVVGSAGWHYVIYDHPTDDDVWYSTNPELWVWGGNSNVGYNWLYLTSLDQYGTW
jgi:hypothetical protein